MAFNLLRRGEWRQRPRAAMTAVGLLWPQMTPALQATQDRPFMKKPMEIKNAGACTEFGERCVHNMPLHIL